MVGDDSRVDHFGWVYASAKDVLATYYAPGSKNYLGGQRVEPTDQIIVIKLHGSFGFSGPPPGSAMPTPTRWPTTMLLRFYTAVRPTS